MGENGPVFKRFRALVQGFQGAAPSPFPTPSALSRTSGAKRSADPGPRGLREAPGSRIAFGVRERERGRGKTMAALAKPSRPRHNAGPPRVAVRATLIAFGILAFFGLGGEVLLRLLGVGIPAFRISGGLLLFWIAFEMVFERRNERKQHTADIATTEDQIRNVAAFPLAIPLMAGPGAITAVILLAGRAGGAPVYLATLIA